MSRRPHYPATLVRDRTHPRKERSTRRDRGKVGGNGQNSVDGGRKRLTCGGGGLKRKEEPTRSADWDELLFAVGGRRRAL